MRPDIKPRASGTKPGLHPKNPHREGYDFAKLCAACPELERHLVQAPHGGPSIDFSKPTSVTALNKALLRAYHGIQQWELPPGLLCPPIPGRLDLLLHAADLLEKERPKNSPSKPVRVLDIGTGANCIYPLLGYSVLGWDFVGTDISEKGLKWAQNLLDANPGLSSHVELRLQPERRRILQGILAEGEVFDLTVCNPPFHASAEEAAAASGRKQRNLAKGGPVSGRLNFGGLSHELWCPGGERSFVGRLIRESAEFPQAARWFTSLVSQSANLPFLEHTLQHVRAPRVRIIDMAQGQKKSRLLAWSFMREEARSE